MDYTFNTSLGQLSQSIASSLGNEFLKNVKKEGVEVLPEEWFVLSLLHEQKLCTQKEIMTGMNQNKARISRILENMANKNLIERLVFKEDKRYRYVRLTPEGAALYQTVEPIANKTLERAFSGFSHTEYIQLLSLCNRVLANLQAQG